MNNLIQFTKQNEGIPEDSNWIEILNKKIVEYMHVPIKEFMDTIHNKKLTDLKPVIDVMAMESVYNAYIAIINRQESLIKEGESIDNLKKLIKKNEGNNTK